MDLRKLRYFITVAEEGHIGRAATALNISQPPLTRQIHQLEEELGVELFNRTPKGMEITEAGTIFLEEARNIFSLVEQATERAQRAGSGRLGRLDVAIFGSGILDTIPRILLSFRSDYPDVKIVLHSMGKGDQIEALRQRRISVAFNRIIMPLPDIKSEVIISENLLLAVNTNSPLSQQQNVDFAELDKHPLIIYPSRGQPNFKGKLLNLFHEAKMFPTISHEVGDAVTGVSLVAGGFGVCVVPESAAALKLTGVKYLPISKAPAGAKVDLSCIYRADDQSPLLFSFLEKVREFSRNAKRDND
ncbi:LysR family transcriptional regulator [Halioxenophilus sp. WMMB6]|uniref:LysR family transcriptional regulator n=1 Tax=Halioxenophilus sp. WMMB6 TaxID=3073815 RepID=UPI00295E46C3|nr:LysR family transcriptional regulator [Halioxenophilus sp. WMMB6]